MKSVCCARSFPPYLFGAWKLGLYEEKLEWDAFRRHLGDLVQLKKYGTEDFAMWGTWLTYGTALGVGDYVEQAMKELRMSAEIVQIYPLRARTFR